MATTANRLYRYPALTSAPNVPLDLQNLATDVDTDVNTVAASLTTLTNKVNNGPLGLLWWKNKTSGVIFDNVTTSTLVFTSPAITVLPNRSLRIFLSMQLGTYGATPTSAQLILTDFAPVGAFAATGDVNLHNLNGHNIALEGMYRTGAAQTSLTLGISANRFGSGGAITGNAFAGMPFLLTVFDCGSLNYVS